MSTVWIKHPVTGLTSEVPADALPIYRQSGWDVWPDDERQQHEKQQAVEQAAADDRINSLAQQALGNEPVTAPPAAPEPDKPKSSTRKSKETG